MIEVYTDGACLGNPGPGGWAALVVDGGKRLVFEGREEKTTNNRMELRAAIEGLARTPPGSHVSLYSDSQYLVYTMTRNWKRKANLDLWQKLDNLSRERQVKWEWRPGEEGPDKAKPSDPGAPAERGTPQRRPPGCGPDSGNPCRQGSSPPHPPLPPPAHR